MVFTSQAYFISEHNSPINATVNKLRVNAAGRNSFVIAKDLKKRYAGICGNLFSLHEIDSHKRLRRTFNSSLNPDSNFLRLNLLVKKQNKTRALCLYCDDYSNYDSHRYDFTACQISCQHHQELQTSRIFH